MGRSSSSGLLLLLIGSLGLIGFLSGQLERWLGFLFTPPGVPPTVSPTGTTATTAANRRGTA